MATTSSSTSSKTSFTGGGTFKGNRSITGGGTFKSSSSVSSTPSTPKPSSTPTKQTVTISKSYAQTGKDNNNKGSSTPQVQTITISPSYALTGKDTPAANFSTVTGQQVYVPPTTAGKPNVVYSSPTVQTSSTVQTASVSAPRLDRTLSQPYSQQPLQPTKTPLESTRVVGGVVGQTQTQQQPQASFQTGPTQASLSNIMSGVREARKSESMAANFQTVRGDSVYVQPTAQTASYVAPVSRALNTATSTVSTASKIGQYVQPISVSQVPISSKTGVSGTGGKQYSELASYNRNVGVQIPFANEVAFAQPTMRTVSGQTTISTDTSIITPEKYAQYQIDQAKPKDGTFVREFLDRPVSAFMEGVTAATSGVTRQATTLSSAPKGFTTPEQAQYAVLNAAKDTRKEVTFKADVERIKESKNIKELISSAAQTASKANPLVYLKEAYAPGVKQNWQFIQQQKTGVELANKQLVEQQLGITATQNYLKSNPSVSKINNLETAQAEYEKNVANFNKNLELISVKDQQTGNYVVPEEIYKRVLDEQQKLDSNAQQLEQERQNIVSSKEYKDLIRGEQILSENINTYNKLIDKNPMSSILTTRVAEQKAAGKSTLGLEVRGATSKVADTGFKTVALMPVLSPALTGVAAASSALGTGGTSALVVGGSLYAGYEIAKGGAKTSKEYSDLGMSPTRGLTVGLATSTAEAAAAFGVLTKGKYSPVKYGEVQFNPAKESTVVRNIYLENPFKTGGSPRVVASYGKDTGFSLGSPNLKGKTNLYQTKTYDVEIQPSGSQESKLELFYTKQMMNQNPQAFSASTKEVFNLEQEFARKLGNVRASDPTLKLEEVGGGAKLGAESAAQGKKFAELEIADWKSSIVSFKNPKSWFVAPANRALGALNIKPGVPMETVGSASQRASGSRVTVNDIDQARFGSMYESAQYKAAQLTGRTKVVAKDGGVYAELKNGPQQLYDIKNPADVVPGRPAQPAGFDVAYPQRGRISFSGQTASYDMSPLGQEVRSNIARGTKPVFDPKTGEVKFQPGAAGKDEKIIQKSLDKTYETLLESNRINTGRGGRDMSPDIQRWKVLQEQQTGKKIVPKTMSETMPTVLSTEASIAKGLAGVSPTTVSFTGGGKGRRSNVASGSRSVVAASVTKIGGTSSLSSQTSSKTSSFSSSISKSLSSLSSASKSIISSTSSASPSEMSYRSASSSTSYSMYPSTSSSSTSSYASGLGGVINTPSFGALGGGLSGGGMGGTGRGRGFRSWVITNRVNPVAEQWFARQQMKVPTLSGRERAQAAVERGFGKTGTSFTTGKVSGMFKVNKFASSQNIRSKV